MTRKPLIRIIKREERNRREKAAEVLQENESASSGAARETVSNVTAWVREFQQRRRGESKRAFKNLFDGSVPRPDEV
jgi:hypothetical protein